MHLASGLSVGLAGVAAGYTIGVVGDAVSVVVPYGYIILTTFQGVRAYMQQSRVYVGMILILIFGEVLGLYGYAAWKPWLVRMLTRHSLIVGLILNSKS